MTDMFRSATFKLTMWYLAIVVAISVLFSIVLYHYATAELARGLHRESQRIFSEFPVFHNSPLLRPSLDFDEAAHRLLLRLLAFNFLVFITAGLASYLLAKRTLSPIELAHAQQQRFTADVSHELRTPLTALRMESEVALLNERATPQELRTTLTSNLEEVTKLETLINSLLRLTRLEEAELRHNFTVIPSSEILTEAIAAVDKQAKQRAISITSQLSDCFVLGDQHSLVQLFVLLLDNAIKYSPEGSSISLTCNQSAKSAIIQIVDHGIGIEAEALTHIFERFYRADSSRNKTQTEGYGLGLSIAKMIADIHEADITLASLPGVGTTATIRLAVASSIKTANDPPKATDSTTTKPTANI
jgi:signal transduction histidine kinase